jgi:hypothetical protein
MNKTILVGIFFITFLLFETLLYYIFKNKTTMKESFLLQKNKTNKTKEPFLETYQGSETNYESCKKSGYPNKWCLHLQEPYSIPNPESLTECI